MNDKNQRRKFTNEFKQDAVKLVIEQGYNASEAGRRLGVAQSNINRWVLQHRRLTEAPSGNDQELATENERLRKENQRLLMERDILKKAAAFFANEPK
jgi:transposase